MSDNVKPWPRVAGRPTDAAPKPVLRPCDWKLRSAVMQLEMELGTIEAYNRLVAAAATVKQRIDAGQAQPQYPQYAVHPRGDHGPR